MQLKKSKQKTIEEYIEAAPEEARERLRQMHECIRKAALGAIEGLKWSMPAYPYKKILVTFDVFRHHIGFYPIPSAVKAFVRQLSKFKTASGSIQFPLEKSLPLPLINKITKFRIRESLKKDKKWRS